MFVLDSVLERDTIVLGSLPLCELLLMNDSQYPWLILVPRVEHACEIIDMSLSEQQQFLLESNAASKVLQRGFAAEKLNVAALGNVVAQLHIHHIARYAQDPAWPKPVWGLHEPRPYDASKASETIALLEQHWSSVDIEWQSR